jgi:hypothetical protein
MWVICERTVETLMDAKVERIGYWIHQQLKRHDPAE